jgi:hypothetical protein
LPRTSSRSIITADGRQDARVQAPPIRDDGLQLNEHREFQRTFWFIQRCAWMVFAFILLLVLAGLSGAGGHLSTATVTMATGQIEYPRISRWQSEDEFTVTFGVGNDIHRLTLSPIFFEYFEVDGVQPQPQRTVASRDGTTLEFAAEAAAPAQVTLYLRGLRPGFPRYSVALDGLATDVSTAILP